MSEWISVEDQLPLQADYAMPGCYECIRVLVTDGDHVTTQLFVRGKVEGINDSAWSGWEDYAYLNPHEITHWMPLPEPPK